MKYLIQDNGNLTLSLDSLTADDIEHFRSQPSQNLDHSILADLLDSSGLRGNGELIPILPEWVPGALTDSPMITDEFSISDCGEVEVKGKVWWYPEYESTDFSQILQDQGKVTFTLAQ